MYRTATAALLVLSATTAAAQEGPRWQRRAAQVDPPAALFHSTSSLNLPTAETMQRGVFQFEISHRFLPPLSDGPSGLWGFDGPSDSVSGTRSPTDLPRRWPEAIRTTTSI